METYIALELLFSESKNKYIEPGEEISLKDEDAEILLAKGSIKEAPKSRQETPAADKK